MNKRKILILITFTIFLVGGLLLALIAHKSNNDEFSTFTSNYELSNITDTLLISNIAIAEDEILDIEKSINEQLDTETVVQENPIQNETKENKKQDIKTQQKTSTIADNKVKEISTVKEETAVAKTENINQNTTEQKQQAVAKTEETIKPTTNTTQNTSSYVVNQNMINKLKKTIEDNATADMQQYGYKIEIDSSIVNKTIGFTYSLFNVTNGLITRTGTIRIYAQDYIVNGKVVETKCYIL